MQGICRRSFLAITSGALFAPVAAFAEQKEEVPSVLDHILLGCNDLDRGVAFVEERAGVRAAFGGIHPRRGTRNALLSLGQKHYLEIIAPDPQQTSASDFRNLRDLAEPRLIGWAVHPGELDAFATRLRGAGVAFEGPTPGSRKRPDGRMLHWKTLNLKDDHGGVLPFFIEWSPDSVHPSADAPAGCKIVRFEMSGPNAEELTRLSKLLELDVRVEKEDKPQLHARIAGPSGKVMEVTS